MINVFLLDYTLAFCTIWLKSISNCPAFRAILLATGTSTYNIAKFLVPILKPLTINDYTLKDTFGFSCDIMNQNSNLFMASLDVDSLFTKIPLDETINIITEKLFSENETVYNFNKDHFKCLLTSANLICDILNIHNVNEYIKKSNGMVSLFSIENLMLRCLLFKRIKKSNEFCSRQKQLEFHQHILNKI